MAAASGGILAFGTHKDETLERKREQLQRSARQLPESELKAAILATLADHSPTPFEAVTWVGLLQGKIVKSR